MITYNHERYIREAIVGVINQRCSFPIELIVSDDSSTDDTLKIIRGVLDGYSNVNFVRVHSHPSNIGMLPNFIWTLEQCHGKYIALCEGDDYWTDPLKLQKQVDFLEAHEDCSLCGHAAFKETDGKRTLQGMDDKVQEVTRTELIKRNPFLTATVMFRRNILPLPEWFTSSPFGDYALYFIASTKGKLYHLPEAMAVYRLHQGGIHAPLHNSNLGMVQIWKRHIRFYRLILTHIGLSAQERIAVGERVNECRMLMWSIVREHRLYTATLKLLPMRLGLELSKLRLRFAVLSNQQSI